MNPKGDSHYLQPSRISVVSRRLALVLLVILAVPALALAAETDPKRKINAADERKAASIVFKRTDFTAGWKRTTSPSTDDDDLSCSFYKPDGSDLTLTGDAEAEFERTGGFPSLLSYADVYMNDRDAAAAWSRTVKPALARCVAQFFEREVSEPGTKVTVVNHDRIAFPRLAPRTAAFRIDVKMAVTQNGQTATVPLTLHIVVVGRGRAEAGFLTFAPSPGIAAADLRDFGKLLAERMKVAGF
jgi:hypothetical protein